MPALLCANNNIQSQLDLAEQGRTGTPQQSQHIIDQLALQTEQMSQQQLHQYTFVKSYLFAIKGELDAAIELAKSLDDSPYSESRIKANLLLANMYEAIKQHQLAYSYLYQALQDAKSNSDANLSANVYTVATQLHISAGVYDKALEYAQKISEVSDSARNKCISEVLQVHALVRLGQSYPDKLLTSAKQGCWQANEPLMAHTLEQFKAEVEIYTNPTAVKASMQAMLPDLQKIGFPYAILRARYHLGYAQLQLEDFPAAEAELQQVQQLAQRLRDSRIENETLLLLAQLYEKTDNTVAAVAAYKQHIAALNSYIDEFKQRSVAYHLAQADFMESENKLALLENKNKLLQLESQLQKDEKLKTLLISFALLTLLLLVIYVLNSKRVALNRLATTDFLTRLFNRRYFNEAVSKHLGNRRQQGECSLIVFDIDLFKQINDQYGHAAGDKVLSAIAQCCQEQIRQQDILARIGGEEFALFLPGCALADAEDIAEQCRHSLEQLVIPFEDQHIQITASFGVATSSNADFDSLLKQADDALYRAKTGGRNRIMVYPTAASKGSSFG
ncbi:tetratricopeptide repeat-containing diguanylate cyclase [Arsukibacterium indicum]|uniref:diguanylate cyclase n=1 Tax=Arsukibacterium indicum TaxID=2848612 RepID=A0ABS6MPX7_9GAMM|nr:diguanylate cyclase [Arsukibacterium indicum]MBV2130429.1 diguanylate cyclase [Arsukibacterium indicum]